MKKIFVILLCAMLILALPLAVSAEGEVNSTAENEIAVEGENSASDETATESIVDYVKENIDKVVVIIVMAGYSIVESKLRGKMNTSVSALNNNAVTIAQESSKAIDKALEKVEGTVEIVREYKDKIDSLLEEIRNSEEEKKALKDALVKVESYLNTAKLANIEFANELAELLCLANIPNAKKDELYAKHIEGVHKLESEEVKSDDGNEA